MSGFWRGWFMIWAISIVIFGLIVAGGAFEATSGPIKLIFDKLHGPSPALFDPALRFSLGVMGGVTIGWAVTLWVLVRAACDPGQGAREMWNAITAGMIAWFVIDSSLSIATGFGLNVVPNALLFVMYPIGLMGSGALRKSA